ncbi:XVIPCD domain-containing protein [Xanthomonas campestris pv. raphani]|uniref:XVIPCD domain-containing protein n=1 Tax=Xanthomonas campestris TaxID=339 RepID=UPI002B2296A6|nr:XVIPCD domain-containing protein [Xanthomonas campestris]MEA9753372.1 XVIPCD domain-containing protein [Xanthomonas campestris pv. raphani]MEA9813661.1 XVIPCD domain-containing protein [Xanthomonas campestris pv. raphani]
MNRVDPRIEPLLAQMAKDPALPAGAENSIRQTIAESPYLSNLLGDAIEKGRIGAIAVSHGQNNGGHFQDGKDGEAGTLNISEAAFKDFAGSERVDYLTEVMGHETMHGVLAQHRADALAEFGKSMGNRMQEAYDNREHQVDLTGPTRVYLDSTRADEALSEISGMRALHDRIKHLSPEMPDSVVEKELLDRSSNRCVVRQPNGAPQFADGLTYDALTKHPFTRNDALTKSVEHCFYDSSGTLGPHGDSDYRNYYGVNPISHIAQSYAHLAHDRQPPEVRIDLKSLGLDPRQLERNGLDLGSAKTFNIVDLGKDGYGMVQLKDTGARGVSSPNLATPNEPGRALTPAEAGHPDHAMHQQIRGKVEQLDAANGRTFDATSERVTASLLTLAKHSGLSRVDHVLLSERTKDSPTAQTMFVVQGDPKDPAMLRAHMPTADAAQRPVQESFTQLESVNQRLAHERAQEMAMEQQRSQEQQQRGPVPSL